MGSAVFKLKAMSIWFSSFKLSMESFLKMGINGKVFKLNSIKRKSRKKSLLMEKLLNFSKEIICSDLLISLLLIKWKIRWVLCTVLDKFKIWIGYRQGKLWVWVLGQPLWSEADYIFFSILKNTQHNFCYFLKYPENFIYLKYYCDIIHRGKIGKIGKTI